MWKIVVRDLGKKANIFRMIIEYELKELHKKDEYINEIVSSRGWKILTIIKKVLRK